MCGVGNSAVRVGEFVDALYEAWLLRVNTCSGDVHQIEQSIHRLLRAADHRKSIGRSAGTEWFLTSLRFLDEVATQKGLTVAYRIEDVDSDDGSED